MHDTKVRHVKQLNLCVRNYHFYSKWFDKLVVDENYGVYMLILMSNIVLLMIALWGNVRSDCDRLNQQWWMFIVDFINDQFVWHQKVLWLFNGVMLFGLLVDWGVQYVAASYNLTYDELFRPQFYPYLFKKSGEKNAVYCNPNGKGFVNNWKMFWRRVLRI